MIATCAAQKIANEIQIDPGTPADASCAMIESFAIEPRSIIGGNTATGTVTLNGPAQEGGKLIRFVSDTANAIIPEAIVIPEGESVGTVQINTREVGSTDVAKIAALWGPTPQVVTSRLQVTKRHP
jgi:hypothetical protein